MRSHSTGGWLVASLFASLAMILLQIVVPPRLFAHAGSTRPADGAGVDPEPDRATSTRRCAEPLRLVASVVNLARPQLSLAVVRSQGGARVLTVGARVDELVLVSLQPEYAALRSPSGELCILPVFDAAAGAVEVAAPEPVRAPSRAGSKPSPSAESEIKAKAFITREKLQKGLRALGGGDYSLSRELLLEALKNPGGAAAGAYFKPREHEGRTVGMEVRAVREGSTLSQMGIRTGDVVRSISGIDVSTPLGLLDALRTARESEAITLTIVREGQERTLRYLINAAS